MDGPRLSPEEHRLLAQVGAALADGQLPERLLHAIIDTTPDLIFIKDRQHRYRMVNRSYARAFHLQPEQFIGKNNLEVGFPEELVLGNPERGIRGLWPDDRQVLDSGEPLVIPHDLVAIDGELRVFHTIKMPLRDAEGRVWGLLGFARDITELRRAEEELERYRDQLAELVAQRTAELTAANQRLQQEVAERRAMEQYVLRTERLAAMGRLAAALAHEINNPLQSMASSLELVLDFPLEEAERLEYLQAVRREIQRLMDLTSRVLDFARPPQVERRPTSLCAAVRHALALAGKQLQHRRIRVETDLPEGLPLVLASADHLSQVFLNLIINAIDAMPGGGRLRVAARLDGDRAEVTFADSGPGIASDALATIFEPFYSTKERGTGLGLSISHSIIQQHNGTITAGNDAGGGALFTIRLPLAYRVPRG